MEGLNGCMKNEDYKNRDRDYIAHRMNALSMFDIINGCGTNFTCSLCGSPLYLNAGDGFMFYCPKCRAILDINSVTGSDRFLVGYRGIPDFVFTDRAGDFSAILSDIQARNGCSAIRPAWKGMADDDTGEEHAPWTVTVCFEKNDTAFVPAMDELKELFSALTENY